MRRLVIIVLIVLFAGLPVAARAQSNVSPVTPQHTVDGSDYGLHPVLAVVAGAVTGVIVASAVAGSLITGSLLLEGMPLAESLEAGTGLSLPAIGASAVLGGMLGHFLFSQ